MFPTLSQQLGVKCIGEMDMDGRTIYVSDARINCREYFTDISTNESPRWERGACECGVSGLCLRGGEERALEKVGRISVQVALTTPGCIGFINRCYLKY